MKKKPERKTKKQKTKTMITKNTIIGAVVRERPELAAVFLEYGLHCAGCAIAQYDTIEAGARAHGIHPERLVKDLNARTAKKARRGA